MPHDLYTTTHSINAINLPQLYKKYGCPVWVYEAEIIISCIKKLSSFDVIRFAQKACSNIHILRLMYKYGVKVDSVSLGEIERALLAGFHPGTNNNEIIFTADILDELTLIRLLELLIPINIGSLDMLLQIGHLSPRHKVWLRINPGFGYGHNQKTNTGGQNSKHGIWYKDLSLALKYVRRYNLHLVGIHMHIGSGVNCTHLSQVCDSMVEQVIACGQDILAISAGGGLSIPYKEKEEENIDINQYFNLWNIARHRISQHLGHSVILEIEPGRFLIAQSGVLVAQVRAVKNMGNHHFILIDAGFNDLMRPVMYGSYHHISLLAADGRDLSKEIPIDTVVGGPLCESGDIFTQTAMGELVPRSLPPARVGDFIILHDTGAYGASMSSNYNSRPLLPEVLFEKGKARLIRRRQCLYDLFKLEINI